jgi:hypothetical protein
MPITGSDEVVAAVVDVSVDVNVSIDVPDHDSFPHVANIWSPVRPAIIKIARIERRIIGGVVAGRVTNAYAGVVSASNESTRAK